MIDKESALQQKKENATLIDYFISFSTFVTLKLKIIIIWHFLNYKTTE